MQPFESGTHVASQPAELDLATFTEDEIARLRALSRRFDSHAEYFEMDLDVRRLEFARWLVQHGRLSEDV